MEYEANEGSLQPRHHVYANNYYSSIAPGYPSLSGPYTRASAMGTDDEPVNKNMQGLTNQRLITKGNINTHLAE
jgi:hypothetical protein